MIRLLLCFRWRRLYALSAGEGVEGKGMIETYKIVSGKYDSLAAPMLPSPHSYVTRGHVLRLKKNRARYDLRKKNFTNRVVNMWNYLPDYVVHADTVNCFKSRLDTFWSNQDLVYNIKLQSRN